jgi:glyoxylase-like metal-dependent hydrolase (beta-lactamase superfamily II)
MDQLIIGLFDNGDRAAQAMHELSSIGVAADDLQALARPQASELSAEVGGETFPATTGENDGLPEVLVNAGLPVGHAQTYAEALRQGHVLLLARANGVPAANIKAVLLSHGALDFIGAS